MNNLSRKNRNSYFIPAKTKKVKPSFFVTSFFLLQQTGWRCHQSFLHKVRWTPKHICTVWIIAISKSYSSVDVKIKIIFSIKTTCAKTGSHFFQSLYHHIIKLFLCILYQLCLSYFYLAMTGRLLLVVCLSTILSCLVRPLCLLAIECTC